MGCFNSKLSPCGPLDYPPRSQQQAKSSPVPTSTLPDGLPTEQSLQGIRLYGVASCGEAALLCSRLVIARGHVLAAVFEGHISPSAAEYCRSHCWEAFVQASSSWQQAPAAAALRALDRGFLTSSKHSMEARLSSGCSATLVHIDLAARTVTVATVGAHGAVGLGSSVATQGPDTTGLAAVLLGATSAGLEASRRGQAGGSSVRKQQRRLEGSEAARGKGQDGVGGRGQRPAAAGLWRPRPLSRFVTLEAPSAECRRGLSGLVDLVQSAMAPATDPIAAATSPTVVPAPEILQTGGAPGVAAFARRGGVGSQPPPPPGPPHALGFGCAKDAVLVSAFESADANPGVAPGAAVRAHTPATPHAHAHVQPPGGGRFAAISRLHCGCDVRVTSRPLALGDECLVLLGGCGGAGGRAAGGARPVAGISSGGGSSSGAGGPGDSSGSAAAAARSVLGGGGITNSGSYALAPQPALCGPAGALSAADAVTLAHEIGAAGGAVPGAGGGGGGVSLTTAGLTRENRFVVLYDSYDSEAAVAAAVAAGVQPSPEVAAAAGPSQAGNRSAQAVASYAMAAAVRNRGVEWLSRGAGAPAPATPPPSAACIAIWLDWGGEAVGTGSGAGDQGATRSQPAAPLSPPLSSSPAALRWELLRAYCRFLIARRRRIATAWQSLAATALMGPLSQPLPAGNGAAAVAAAGAGGAPSWVPAQIPVLAAAAGAGGPAGSQESVTGGGVAALGVRTASFTSRAPVMMEFVEELPTPAPSVTMVAGRNPQARTAPGAPVDGGPAITSSSAHTGSGAGGASASGAGMCTAAANAAAATLDESHTHSASTAVPYGISGLVVQPMGSTEEMGIQTVGDDRAASIVSAAAAAAGTASAAAAGTGGSARGRAQAQLSQRSFVMPYGSVLARRAEALGLRSSHSTPDLQNLAAAARTPTDSPRWSQAYSGDGGGDSAARVAAADQATAHEAEAVAYAQGSAYYSSQASSAASAASTATAATCGGAGGSGNHFDWSLIMASVNPNSAPNRPLNSAGHTPIPSTAVNRLPPQGFSPEGGGGDLQAAASGGYLPISGGGSFQLRQAAAAPLPQSPLASGLGAVYGARGTASASAGSSTSSHDGGGGGVSSVGVAGGSRGVPVFSSDMQPPPGVLVGGGSVHSDCDTADAEGEVELISEDLPQLRIESTAELAALMAEIIITEDGEVVRTGSGGGGLPLPYNGRSHGPHHGLHHKGSRALSRQGSRGWQPRLAIVREDAREANTSTSCSQPLLGDGIRFTAITEERGSSQGSSGAGEHSRGGSTGSNTSRHSRLASNSASNGTASNGSPNGSVEEQLAALNGEAAVAILVPPSVPPSRPWRRELGAAADAGANADAADGFSNGVPATAVAEISHSPWIHSGISGADGDAGGASEPAPSPGLSLLMPASQQQYRHQQQHQQLVDQLALSLTPSLTSPPQLPLPPNLYAINLKAAAVAAGTDASAGAADADGAGGLLTEASVRARSFRRERSAVAEAASSAAGADAALAGAIACAVGVPAQLMPVGVVPPVAAAAMPAAALTSTAPLPLRTENGVLADVLADLRPSAGKEQEATGHGGGGKAKTTAAAAAASDDGGEGRDAAAGDLHDGGGNVVRLRPNLAMVGRSRSASATRPAQLSHLRHLLYPGSLQLCGDAHQGQGVSGGDGGGEAPLLVHTASAQHSPAGAVQPPPRTAAMPRARHLYGLTEAAPPLAAANSAARSYCSATAVTASPSPAPQAAYDAATAGAGNTATTLDRSWSMGSTSGLCSLLHSTMSKSSMTVAMSTAVQTPGCNSAHCSGGRLPTVNFANVPLLPPPPLPLQTQSPAAAVPPPAAPLVAAAVAMPAAALRVLPRSLSASRPEPSSDSGPSSATAAAADVAAATVLPSLPADCAAPAAAALDDSSQSVTLHAPRFAGWEPHAAGSVAVSSSNIVAAAPVNGGDGDGAADAEGSGVAADGGGSPCCCYPSGECSLVFSDVAGTSGTPPVHRPRFTQMGSQSQPHHQHYHTLHQQRSSCLPPTRLSRPGFAGGDPTFGSPSAMEGRDSNAGSPHELPADAAVAAASASRSPEISSALALGTAASVHLAPGLSRALGGSTFGGGVGGGGGPQGSGLADAVSAYDDGAVNNRSSNISRSDASVWTSTSAWTASTGRTTDAMMVLGGSNRRVLMGTMGGGGGSSALMLHTGLAVAGGGAGGGGAGDTSGLLAYNAACSSASGLLMTADAGAPGSNTQLLMQMAPPQGAFGAVGGYGGAGTAWPSSNGQTSSQLFCSPRYGVFFGGGPAAVGGGGAATGGEGSVHQGQLMAALAAQVRANHSVFCGASPTDSPPFLHHHHHHHQQHMQPVCGGDGRGGGPVAERPVGHHTALSASPASRGAPTAPQAGGPAGSSHPPGHHLHQQPPAPGIYDSMSSQAPLYSHHHHHHHHPEGVLDSGCYLLAGGSTSNNNGQP